MLQNDKSTGSVGDASIDKQLRDMRDSFIENAEEVNFRFSSLLSAYTNPTSDAGAIGKRAVRLRDAWDEFKDDLQLLIDAYESV